VSCVVTGSVKGGELFEFIETEGRVDEDVTVRLLRQVLECVQFLHSHNILHMDIKVHTVLYISCWPFYLRASCEQVLFLVASVCLCICLHKILKITGRKLM